MVASGKMPTTSPRRRKSQGDRRARTRRRRGRPGCGGSARMSGPRDPVVEQLALGHEPRAPADPVDGEPAVHEVDVADVVDRQQRAAGARQVLEAGHRDALSQRAEPELGEPDDRRVRQLGHGELDPYVAGRRPRRTSEASTSPRSRPAASTESGTSGRLGEPGRDVDLEEPHRAVVVRRSGRSARGRAARAPRGRPPRPGRTRPARRRAAARVPRTRWSRRCSARCSRRCRRPA